MLKKGAATKTQRKEAAPSQSMHVRGIGTGRYVAEHSVKKEAFGLEQHLVKYFTRRVYTWFETME